MEMIQEFAFWYFVYEYVQKLFYVYDHEKLLSLI
jgi:hypothetical protein